MKYSMLFSALLLGCIFNSVYSQHQPIYQIQKTFSIKSAGGYDYLTVDAASNNLYISQGEQVNVLEDDMGHRRVAFCFR